MKAWLIGIGITGVLVISALVTACQYFRVSSPGELQGFIFMQLECHPVWREFAFKRLGPGDPDTILTRTFSPSITATYGRFSIYYYYPAPLGPNEMPFSGFQVYAIDGRLAYAGGAGETWKFTFFDKFTPAEDAELDALVNATLPPP